MKYKNFTLTRYLNVLASREPVPGGGSAAALSAAMGAALLGMVARYSIKKTSPARVLQRINRVIKAADDLQSKFLKIVDADAAAYLKYSRIPKTQAAAKRKALQEVSRQPREVCRLCAQAIDVAPVLVSHGNPYLLSDVEVAVELLWGAHRSALALIQ